MKQSIGKNALASITSSTGNIKTNIQRVAGKRNMTAFLIIVLWTPTVLGHHLPSNPYIHGLCGCYFLLSKKKKKEEKCFCLGAGSVLFLITLWNLVLFL